MKNKSLQRYIFKINSQDIIKANYSLTLSLRDARLKGNVIGLSESQLMRFIDYKNRVGNKYNKILEIKSDIQLLKAECLNTKSVKDKITALYDELDYYIFKKDLVNVVMDSPEDYRKLHTHGFEINGIKFHRLVGTTNGVKKNTITFVNEDLWQACQEFIDNGRDMSKEFVTAKLEAYKSLVCSSSIPVSEPDGIIVVPDCATHFTADYIRLDDTNSDEPEETFIKGGDVTLDNSDGYGMAMPELMLKWGTDLGLNYMIPGCVIRNSFCKGAVFPVNFQKFCREHDVTFIKDVWGVERDISKVQLVLTESMLKLWSSYESMESYLDNCHSRGYTFAITKCAEPELENQRTTNYQFIQSYDFSDEDIDELLHDTITEIQDIKSGDFRKTVLYMKGGEINKRNVIEHIENDGIASALMINPEVMKDPYIHTQIDKMISKRIDDAKIGVINIEGNYSLVSGDPYSLCQSMCGLEITGLLKAHQVYAKYWVDKGVDKIAVFRAPMTSHNNIRILDVVHDDVMDEFYQYMTTNTILNSWDMCANALNGCDFDGDCTINTNNHMLVDKAIELPAIDCVQRTAPKEIADEDKIVESNIKSFGNAVGSVTNKVTSMFDVRDAFDKNSEAYCIIDYRIRCGQTYQQNAIDQAKGIQAKDMPKHWYQKYGIEDDFLRSLAADRKPYFMRYIYPTLNKECHKYEKTASDKCFLLFGISLDELLCKSDLSEDEKTFKSKYYHFHPTSCGPCVVNRICYKVENVFKEKTRYKSEEFDYSIYKSGTSYPKTIYKRIENIYKIYKEHHIEYKKQTALQRISDYTSREQRVIMFEEFKRDCYKICPDQFMLCDIVIDLCYNSNNNKRFAWDICGDVILINMLKKCNFTIQVPVKDEAGDIVFNGEKYKMQEMCLSEREIFDVYFERKDIRREALEWTC